MTADEGGKSRLANVTAALNARLQALPPSSAVGLWTFDGVAGRSEVPMGPLDDQVGGNRARQVLTANLNGRRPATAVRCRSPRCGCCTRRRSPTSVRASPIRCSSSPRDRTPTSRSTAPGLQDFIRQNFNQARPVAVNVIDFGADPDRATWEAVAQATGGGLPEPEQFGGPGAHRGADHRARLTPHAERDDTLISDRRGSSTLASSPSQAKASTGGHEHTRLRSP